MRSNGYLSRIYAEAFAHLGELIPSPSGAGWLLLRDIPGTDYQDVCNVYPYFFSNGEVTDDILGPDQIFPSRKILTATLVTDPLDSYPEVVKGVIESPCGGYAHKYKDNYIADLYSYDRNKLPENHRRNIRKAYDSLDIDVLVGCGSLYAGSIAAIYGNLISKHGITGVTAYSEAQITSLVEAPGAVLFLAGPDVRNGEVWAFGLFYLNAERVYYVCSAQTPEGYRHSAMFGIVDFAMYQFRALGVERVLLGGKADHTSGEGLERFKSGFASSCVPNYMFKLVNEPTLYRNVCKRLGTDPDSNYFPAYRG